MTFEELQTWELWYPGAGATGLPVARARIDPQEAVWAHSVPRQVSVTVRHGDDRVVGRGEGLTRTGPYVPMTRLALDGDVITREDRWPADADLGAVVILPGMAIFFPLSSSTGMGRLLITIGPYPSPTLDPLAISTYLSATYG